MTRTTKLLKEILEGERKYQEIIGVYGYKNWADSNTHQNPESIVLMVILKKILDIEKKLQSAGVNKK